MNLSALSLLIGGTLAICCDDSFASDYRAPKELTIRNPSAARSGEPFGCLVGTIGGRGVIQNVARFTLFIRAAEAPQKSTTIEYSERNDTAGQIPFAICMHPGRYELVGFSARMTGYSVGDKPWRIPLSVNAGEYLYIGSFSGHLWPSDNCSDEGTFGPRNQRFHLEVRDRFVDERESIQTIPAVSGQSVISAMPDIAGLEPLLYACPKP